MPPPEEWFRLLDSWSRELLSATDRVEYLIGQRHQPSKGTYREALLRRLLRRVLPDRFRVSTGFIYRWGKPPSRQIDVLIWDALEHSALLEEGEFVVLTADSVAAIIEVKSTLNRRELCSALMLLSPDWWINWRFTKEDSSTELPQRWPDVPFRAVFAYSGMSNDINATAKTVFSELASFYRWYLGDDARRAIEENPQINNNPSSSNLIDVICVAHGPQIEQASLIIDYDDGSSDNNVPCFASYTGHIPRKIHAGANVSVGRFCMKLLSDLTAWQSEAAQQTLRAPANMTTPAACYFGEIAETPNRVRVWGEDVHPEALWYPDTPLW